MGAAWATNAGALRASNVPERRPALAPCAADRRGGKRVETEERLEAARKRVRETEARLAALATQAEQEMPGGGHPVVPEAESRSRSPNPRPSLVEGVVRRAGAGGVVVEMEPSAKFMSSARSSFS